MILLIFLLFLIQTASAHDCDPEPLPVQSKIYNESPFILTEIYPAPNSGESEWIEIHNPSNDTKTYNLFLKDAAGTIADISLSLQENEYYVYELSSSKLNNGGDTVSICTDTTCYEEIAYGSTDLEIPNKGESLALVNSDWHIFDTPSPGEKNILTIPTTTMNIVTTTVTTSTLEEVTTTTEGTVENSEPNIDTNIYSVQISEFIPNPEGSDDHEWIELFNATTSSINVYGLLLSDESNSAPFIFTTSTNIDAQSYLVINRNESGIALNNNGDTITLGTSSTIIHQVTYEESEEGLSISVSSTEQWVSEPTPGAPNAFPIIIEEDEDAHMTVESFDQLHDMPDDTEITLSGIISVVPGDWAKTFGYVMDPVSAETIQLYSYKKEFPSLHTGQMIKVTGALSTLSTGRRLKTSGIDSFTTISLVSSSPFIISLSHINEYMNGAYIMTSGTVSDISKTKAFIDNGRDELIITGSAIDTLSIRDTIEVTGVLKNKSGELQLLVENVLVLNSPIPKHSSSTITTTTQSPTSSLPFVAPLALTTLGGSFFLVKKRRSRRKQS